MTETFPPVFFATAVEAVLRAGAIQTAPDRAAVHVRKKGTIDLVTEIDLQVERMFRALIADRFPDHVVLAEEFASREDHERHARYCWVFDPIDGTTNYAHGLPIFCSACSLEVDGSPIAAAVYDPSRRELFTAERGVGAWLNGAPLRVSSADTLVDSLLCTGFPYTVQEKPRELVALFSDFLERAQAVRRLGSAALDLCYVAAGRFDGFWETRLYPWDISAGGLLVEEAGGRASRLDGGAFDSRLGEVVASNGRIHDQMIEIIRASQASGRARNWTV